MAAAGDCAVPGIRGEGASRMEWLYLVIAGVCEIGWPLGLKLSQTTEHRVLWVLFAVAAMALSGLFLWLAQREIPIGTAYAVWTGIGAAGTFAVGILMFRDPATALRILSVLLIMTGIIGLKLAH
jgi:quaternary ammonium compound-resistance protein SugE